jgi:hypothetical protein
VLESIATPNAQRQTLNFKRSTGQLGVGRWALDVGRCLQELNVSQDKKLF